MHENQYTEFISNLNSRGIKSFGLYDFKLICLYDDDSFSNIDYDFVSNQHRSFIREALISMGWSAKSSRLFIKDDTRVTFPRPSPTLGADPSDPVIFELKNEAFVFCTATQAMLTMARQKLWSQSIACEMIQKCPANIDKVYQWLKEGRLETPTKEDLGKLKTTQRESFDEKIKARKKI